MIEQGIVISECKRDLYVESDRDLQVLAEALGRNSAEGFEVLSGVFNKMTGRELHDYRDDTEYTGVNAQADIDFFEEESLIDNEHYE